jgi:hypothetical protein
VRVVLLNVVLLNVVLNKAPPATAMAGRTHR